MLYTYMDIHSPGYFKMFMPGVTAMPTATINGYRCEYKYQIAQRYFIEKYKTKLNLLKIVLDLIYVDFH